LKALAKDRDQRYQSMKEMAIALEQCEGGDLSNAWGNEPSGPGLRESSQAFRTPGTAARNAVGTQAATTSSPELGQAPKKRTGLVVGGVLALLLAGGGAAVVLSQKKPVDPPKPVVTAPVVVAKPPVAEEKKPVEPAKPSRYTMSINTQPAGAEVFNGSERLCVTPCNVPLPASETPVDLMLKKKGFKEQTLKIVPDKDHDYLVDLMSTPKPHAPSAKTPKSTAPAATPAATPAAKPEAPKPAGKLRDLKDPFAN
jgi:hypothetical protein